MYFVTGGDVDILLVWKLFLFYLITLDAIRKAAAAVSVFTIPALSELQAILNHAGDLSWCSTKPFQYGVHLAKTTYFSSPKMSGKVHCIFLARTYSSWSTTTQEFGLG